MNFPPGFGMVCISSLIGVFCVYMYYLDKKAKKMQETEEGRAEFYEKYTPKFVKKKREKMGYVSLTKEAGKPNSRVRMSKKERRKAKEEINN